MAADVVPAASPNGAPRPENAAGEGGRAGTGTGAGDGGADKPRPDAALLGRTLSGLRTTGVLTALKTVIDLGGQLALARLLAPAAFGVFGFAQSLSGLVSCFTDLSGQRYLIQKKDGIDRRALNTVFTLELGLGVLVAALWALLAGPVLSGLGRPEQAPFARALAIWIVLERLMLPRALLDRALAFGRSNLALVWGTVAGVGAMLASALAGAGAYTFIVGLIVRTGVASACLWAWAPVRPRIHFERALAKPFLAFGLPITLTSAMTFYYTNVDYIIVQAALGYGALGLYYAAYRYPHYIHQFQYLVSTVVFPAFSRATDRGQLARGFSHVTKYAAAVGLPPLVAVWVIGEDAVRVVLSEKWTPATFCFQVFTLLAVMRLVTVYWYDVYVSQGRTRLMPWISGGNAVMTTLAAWWGVRWAGIEGAALLVTLSSALTMLFCCNVLLKRLLSVRYLDILRNPLAAGAVSAWAGWLLARNPWLGAGEAIRGSLAWLVADVALRGAFIFAVFAAVFLWLDRRDLATILQRWKHKTPTGGIR